jgi:hypothetical protein
MLASWDKMDKIHVLLQDPALKDNYGASADLLVADDHPAHQ